MFSLAYERTSHSSVQVEDTSRRSSRNCRFSSFFLLQSKSTGVRSPYSRLLFLTVHPPTVRLHVALLLEYVAHLLEYVALLLEYVAHLQEHIAHLQEHIAHLQEHIALFSTSHQGSQIIMFTRNRLTSPKSHATAQRPHSCFKVERLEDRSLPSIAVGVYSPIDEVGNNVANPDWAAAPADQPGGAAIQLLRLSPQEYANGFSTPSLPYGGATAGVGGNVVTSFPMPSPRTISNDLFNQSPTLFGSPATDINTVDSNGLSDFGYSFGQFMDHDMDLTPDQTGLTAPPGDPAANKDGNDGFPIPADTTNPGDPIGSLAFSRSVYDPTTGSSAGNPRQQTNVITSYLDLSQVYGSSLAVSDALRSFSGGQLKTSPGNMLPYDNLTYFTQAQINALNMADSGPLPESSLYAAGDVRANENTELTSLTTLFVRNHNAIAAELQQENPTWTDQQLFEEARKLNIAEYQNIIYTQYLPALLGPYAPAYTGYNPNVNASIATEFSTVAYRFGHSMLNNTVERDANSGTSVGNVPLAVDFFDANLVNPSGAIDPFTGLAGTDIGAFLKGDADSSSQADDSMAVSSVRDLLFGNGGGGEDLISRDIWRARDDGIGTYNQVRVALGLPAITDDATFGFDQITSNVQVQQELETAYAKTIDAGGFAGDIDAFAGGMAEDHLPGSDMGPLFTAILTKQFSNLENGDQYFYRNELFTTQDLAILNQGTTLAQIITTNTGVTNLQANVFYYQPQTIVNNTLYVVGGSGTNDNVQINPIGTSNTGSTGVQVVATLRGVNTTTTYSQAFTSIVFFGGSGNDNINVASSLTIPVSVNAGNGNDNVNVGAGSTITLGNGNDNVTASASSIVTLGNGNDNINLGAGSSTITAGNGNDNINDSNGTATVTLGSGNDNINLGAGSSTITLGSGTGNDNINDSNGTATIIGGGANGNINVNLGAGSSTITLGNGNDNINDSNGTATVTLGSGNDNVNIGNGNNVITTGNGNDNINAGNGNNVVVTGNGSDNINAGNGDNLIVAGLGQHNVYVGNGSNILIDGSVTLTPGVTLSQVLTEWISFGAADAATIQSQMSITYNTKYANNLYAGTGLDWFFYTDTQDHTSYNADDLLN